LSYQRYEDEFEVPQGVTQSGIADAVWIHQKHVPRTIRKMQDKDLVMEKISHITGVKQKRKVYFLTPAGTAKALKLKEFILERTVLLIDSEKEKNLLSLRRLSDNIEAKLTLVEILLHINSEGVFNVNTIDDRPPLPSKKEKDLITSSQKHEIYKAALKRAWKDSVITLDERAILEDLRVKLGISERDHRILEEEILDRLEVSRPNIEIYKVALREALSDSKLTRDEKALLKKLRETLNISIESHDRMELEIRQEIMD